MDPKEAFKLINAIVGSVKMNRKEHMVAIEALSILEPDDVDPKKEEGDERTD